MYQTILQKISYPKGDSNASPITKKKKFKKLVKDESRK